LLVAVDRNRDRHAVGGHIGSGGRGIAGRDIGHRSHAGLYTPVRASQTGPAITRPERSQVGRRPPPLEGWTGMALLTFYYGVSAGAETASVVDPVTGLAVRSALLADLSDAVVAGSRTSLLAVFALDGLKEFEELKGVLEGRKLLRRLG